jgi:hypothetical protein
MGAQECFTYITSAKSVLDIFKGIRAELPKGEASEKVLKHIEEAETALKKNEAELAQALGYNLCQCQFPPRPMLWNESQKVCQNPECGHIVRIDFNRDLSGAGSWMGASRLRSHRIKQFLLRAMTCTPQASSAARFSATGGLIQSRRKRLPRRDSATPIP